MINDHWRSGARTFINNSQDLFFSAAGSECAQTVHASFFFFFGGLDGAELHKISNAVLLYFL